MQYQVFLSCYPPWLVSTILSTDSSLLTCSDRNTAAVAEALKSRDKPLLEPHAPQRTCSNVGPQAVCDGLHTSPPSFSTSAPATATPARRLSPFHVQSSTRPSTSRERVTPRVAVPLPFSDARITNRVDFHSRGCKGISLGEWAKLAEKGKTALLIDDPQDPLDELFSSEDSQLLFQSHWPGYDPRTCYLDLPAHVAVGERALTKVDVLDVACKALVDWVLRLTNCRQIECREPGWAIGLKQITFRHIYVTSVVEVEGYVSKWVPVLEIDPRAFQPQCQL